MEQVNCVLSKKQKHIKHEQSEVNQYLGSLAANLIESIYETLAKNLPTDNYCQSFRHTKTHKLH